MYRISAPPCVATLLRSREVLTPWPPERASPPVPLSAYAERGDSPLAPGNRPDHEERLRPRCDRLRERGIGRVVGQVPLAGKEPQERPSPLGDVVTDRAAQHGIAGLERVQHRTPSDPARDVELHFAFDLRQRPQVRGKHHADHCSVWTSTDRTAGRSRTMGAQLSPASADAYTCPPVVPKYTPHGSSESTAIASRSTFT